LLANRLRSFLSAATMTRLTAQWQDDAEAFTKRSLNDTDYVYVWVDGIHLKVRLEADKVCLLVMIGVRADGTKELVALADAFRESSESWADLLRSCRRRGMTAPVLAVGDGALGFWKALREVFPATREQRCWFHVNSNVLAALPKSAHPDFAYRRVGDRGGMPLVLANYFSANMDDWDPIIVDGLAADRDVITFDYPGIGSSAGATPATVAEFAVDCVGFLHALGLTTVDFLGFSLGGMVAQQIASSHPEMFRRMILSGTGPRGGEKMTFTELSIHELKDPVALLLNSFFTPSDASQAAGHAYLDRLNRREADRDTPVTMTAAAAQLGAIREWGEIPTTDRYAMLSTIRQPTLIVHGAKDIVVDPVNAIVLQENLCDARLLILPDASHAVRSQHAEVFLANARLFLNS
jgi:pimeloyl-ACP methyl ester carboxylesterase